MIRSRRYRNPSHLEQKHVIVLAIHGDGLLLLRNYCIAHKQLRHPRTVCSMTDGPNPGRCSSQLHQHHKYTSSWRYITNAEQLETKIRVKAFTVCVPLEKAMLFQESSRVFIVLPISNRKSGLGYCSGHEGYCAATTEW